MSRFILIVVGVGVALAAAWWATLPVTPTAPQAGADVAGAAPMAGDVRPGVTKAAAARWVIDDHRAYTLRSARTLTQPSGQTQRLELAGHWHVRVAENQPRGPVLSVHLRDARLQAEVGEDTRAFVPAGLETPFALRLDSKGAVQAVGFEEGVAPLARALLAAVAADLQVTLRPDEDAWVGIERAPTGRYRARYLKDGARLERRALRYLELASVAGQAAPAGVGVTIERSKTAIDLDDHRLAGLEHRERLRYTVPGPMPSVTFEVETTAQATALAGEAPRHGDVIWAPIDAPAAAPVDHAAHDAQRVGDADLPTLLDGLGDLEARERAQRLSRLAALLRLQPELADAVAEHAADPAVAGAIVGALSSAGTPAAQAALVDIINDAAHDAELRAVATAQLGLVSTPTPETVDALRAARDADAPAVASAATLALGTAARHAEVDLDGLLDDARGATTPGEMQLYLNALGNAGDPGAWDLVTGALRHDDENVRASAAYALRFMPGARAEALLTRLAGEATPRVRRRAEQGLLARARAGR